MKIKFLIMSLLLFLSACATNTIIAVPTNTEKVIDTPTAILIDEPIPTSEQEKSEEQVFGELCQSAGYQGLANFYPNINYSPTREWAFASCENTQGNNTSYPFVISHVLGGQTIKPITLPLDWIEESTIYKPKHWNDDESALIVSAFDIPCPDSILCLYEDGDALFEIDLESREVSALLSPQKSSYAFSISPDGKYLGYIDQSVPGILHVQDLISGEDKSVNLEGDFIRVGAFAWTPDNKELLLIGLSYVDDVLASSLFLFDIANSSLIVLLNQQSGIYFPGDLASNGSDYWYQQDILYLGSVDNFPLYVNIRTKEVNQISTLTP